MIHHLFFLQSQVTINKYHIVIYLVKQRFIGRMQSEYFLLFFIFYLVDEDHYVYLYIVFLKERFK